MEINGETIEIDNEGCLIVTSCVTIKLNYLCHI